MSSILLINPPVAIEGSLFNEPPFSNVGMYYSIPYLTDASDVDVVDSFSGENSVYPIPDGIHLGQKYESLIQRTASLDKKYDHIIINFSWFKRKEIERKGPDDFRRFLSDVKAMLSGKLILCDFHIGHMFFERYDPCHYMQMFSMVDMIFTDVAETKLRDFIVHDRLPEKGISYRSDDGIFFGDFDLDYVQFVDEEAPYPAYEYMDMDGYRKFISLARRNNVMQEQDDDVFLLPLMLSRGCAFNCNFCGLGLGKSRWASYPIEYVEKMITSLSERFSVNGFLFLDPSMNSNPSWFKTLLRILKDHSLHCLIPNGLRGDLIDEETTYLLKDVTGVVLVSLETGNHKIVNDFCGKSFNIEKFHDFVRLAYSIGLAVKCHYIIGFPEETITDMSNTLIHAMRLFDEYAVHPLPEIATPLPGTDFFDYCSKNELLSVPEEELKKDYHVNIESKSMVNSQNFSAEDVTQIYHLFKHHVTDNRMREIFINPTYRCNDNCIHCIFNGISVKDKTLEDCLREIDAAHEYGYDIVCFEGGEPSISPNIITLVRYARRKGFKNVLMDTNGRMFANLEFTRKIMHAGLSPVHIALHSWRPETHERITRAEGSHLQVVKGIRNILNLGYKDHLKITMPLNKLNLNDVSETVNFCYRMGVRSIFLQYLSHKRGLKEITQLPTYGEASAVIRSVMRKFGDDMEIYVQNMPLCVIEGLEDNMLPDVGNTGYLDDIGERRPIYEELAYGKIKEGICHRCVYNFLCTGYLPSR